MAYPNQMIEAMVMLADSLQFCDFDFSWRTAEVLSYFGCVLKFNLLRCLFNATAEKQRTSPRPHSSILPSEKWFYGSSSDQGKMQFSKNRDTTVFRVTSGTVANEVFFE